MKKLLNINNWLILFFFPISILFLFIILITKPFMTIRFGQIQSYRFGHYIKNVELYLSEKKTNPNTSIDIFFLSSNLQILILRKCVKEK